MPSNLHTFDLEYLLSLKDEGQFYNLVSDKFNEINGDFYARANLILLERLKLKPDSSVLDLACGTGHLAIEIAKRVPQGKVVGVDMASEMLAKGRADAKTAGVRNVDFIERDITQILPEFKPGSFDVGVSCFALSYLGTDFLLKEMFQILGDRGQLGITTSSVNSLTEWHSIIIDFFTDHPHALKDYGAPPMVDMPLNAEDMKKRAKAAGFGRVQVESLKIPLSFSNGKEGAAFLISAGWLSNYFYKIQDRKEREALLDWGIRKVEAIHAGAPSIETSIEFLVAFNEL